jgi:hypothetical protein
MVKKNAAVLLPGMQTALQWVGLIELALFSAGCMLGPNFTTPQAPVGAVEARLPRRERRGGNLPQ